MTNSSRLSRVTPKIKHNNFSNYTATLSQSVIESIDNKYSYPPPPPPPHYLKDDQYLFHSQILTHIPSILLSPKNSNYLTIILH